MEKPLSGIYHVSFDIEIESEDALNLSDLSFLLTEGVGEGLASKLSHLSVEKIQKTGNSNSSLFKTGDKVQLIKEIKILATIYEDNGYMFIGEPTESANMIGEQEVLIQAGSVGYVNMDNGENIQIIDLDLPISASLIDVDTDEIIEAKVNVDFITLSADVLEKIDTEGGK